MSIETWGLGPALSAEDKTQLLRYAREVVSRRENDGEIYQVRFEAALEELIAEKQIQDWRATIQNGPEDVMGIDYFVRDGKGDIPFQVSSGTRHSKGEARRRKKEKIRESGIEVVNTGIIVKNKAVDLKPVETVGQEIMAGVKNYRKRHPITNG